jgi:hypothetical protein
LVREADDRAVFCPTPAAAVDAQPLLRAWLGTRGWRGSDAKTPLRHRREGFHCLGCTLRHSPTPQRSMKRRPPSHAAWWRTQTYGGPTVGRQDRWVFQDQPRHGTRRKFAWTKIRRHRLVPTTEAPDAPTLHDDWVPRRRRARTTAGRAGPLARRPPGLGPVCHQALENGEDLPVHPVVPKPHGGPDELANRRLGHPHGHRQLHSTSAPLGVRRWLEPCTG